MEAICAALGIRVSALFSDTRLTPAERRDAAEAKPIRDEHQRRQRAVDREQRTRVFKLEKLMDALGAKLTCRPDDDELGRLFHQACDRLHEAEATMPGNHDGPMRQPEPSAIRATVREALLDIAQTFDRKEKAASQAA